MAGGDLVTRPARLGDLDDGGAEREDVADQDVSLEAVASVAMFTARSAPGWSVEVAAAATARAGAPRATNDAAMPGPAWLTLVGLARRPSNAECRRAWTGPSAGRLRIAVFDRVSA